MESIRFQGPVTALKLKGDELYAGIGRCIYVYNWCTGELLLKRQIFALNKIHGITIQGESLAVWGAKSVAFTSVSDLQQCTPKELSANDWIVAIGLGDEKAFVQTAHNQVVEFDLRTHKVLCVRNCTECSILYSGKLFPSKNLCAAGTVLGGVVVWDYTTEEILFNFTEHEGSIFYVEFSRCGNFLATCSDDRSVIVWDLSTGRPVGRGWGHASRIWQLDFTNDGNLISASEDCTARQWRINEASGELITTQVFHGHHGRNVWCLSAELYKGDTILATGGGDGRIKLQNISQSRVLKQWSIKDIVGDPYKDEHFKDYRRLGDRLVLTTSSGRVLILKDGIWECLENVTLDEYSVVRTVGQSFVVAARDGRFLAISGSNVAQFTVGLTGKLYEVFPLTFNGTPGLLVQTQHAEEPYRIVDLEGTVLRTYPPIKTFMITSAAVYEGILFVGSRSGAIAAWNGLDWEVNRRVFQTQDTITSFTFVENSLMITCKSGHYGLFSANQMLSALYTNKLQRGSIERVQVQENGDVLFFGFKTDKFFIWNVTHDYEVVSEVCGGAHRAWCIDVNSSDESRFELYFTKAGRLSLVSKPGNEHFKQTMLRGGTHGREIRGLEFSPGHEGLLASASEDTCVNLAVLDKDIIHTKLSLRYHVSGIQALHWSPCGRYLLTSGGREELIWWDVKFDGQSVYAMEIGRLPTVSTSPDLRIMDFDVVENQGSYVLATGYSDSTIRIWRFAEGVFELLAVRKYRDCCILNIHLAGGLLVASATDGHVVVWDVHASWALGEPVIRHKIHQSGVRCSAVDVLDGTLYHYSGGDDNALVMTAFDSNFQVQERFVRPDAHSSTITSVVLTDDAIYTTGCDQKVRKWTLKGDLVQSVYTSVADTGTLAKQSDRLVAGGMGLALFKLI